jgi:uncharacterized repeat protein (TIGR03803 family)
VGCGTVFEVDSTGKESVVYSFTGVGDGIAPVGGLIDVGGKLYGTTSEGGAGSGCAMGCGTVFTMNPDGTSEKIIYNFEGGSDGATPVAGLVDVSGTFYGTTENGGITTALCSQGCGTIFSIDSSGDENVIYKFAGGKDGAFPVSRLIALNGTLYGTTQYGGATTAFCATGCGTLFRMSTSGTKKVLYSFKYSNASGDGAFPAAGPTAMSSQLYGTTMGGGKLGDGTVFKVNPSSGSERVLHSFDCCASSTDGEYPFGHLTRLGGALYGTTRNGGTGNKGIIFRITPVGEESVLYDFAGKPDGANPLAGLYLSGGTLYGTTSSGGARGEGSVFSFEP